MRRSTWILLGLVAVLAALILLWERRQPTTQEAEENRLKLWTLDTKQVSGLSRTGAFPLALVKGEEDHWRLTAPMQDVVDRFGVEGFLDRIAQAKVLRWVDAGASSSQLGLEPPRGAWTLSTAGGTFKLEIGSKAPFDEGLYVRAQGKVALVPSDLESLLLKPVDDFRLKTLVAETTPDMRSLRLTRPDAPTLACLRADAEGWQITAPYEDWGASEKLERILDDVALCPVDSFLTEPPKDLKPLGLDPPALEARIEMKKGRPVEIRLGGAVPGTGAEKRLVYAMVSGRPTLMAVSLNSLKSLDEDVQGLRSLELFRHDFFDAKELALSGAAGLTLVRGKDGGWQWKVPAAPPKGADASVLAAAIQSLRGERAMPAADLAGVGLARPEYTISLKGDGFEERVLVGSETGGLRYAKPQARPAVLPLGADAWKRLQEAIKLAAGAGKAGAK